MLLVLRTKPLVIAAALVFCGSLIWGQRQPASLLISESGKSFAQVNNGHLSGYGIRRSSFRASVWGAYFGVDPSLPWRPIRRICDLDACRYMTVPAITRLKTLDAVQRACSEKGIVILPAKYRRYCKGDVIILTEEALEKKGPAAIYRADTIKVEWSSKDTITEK